MILIFAEKKFCSLRAPFFVREAEVGDISEPKADNFIIQFNSHNFSPVDLTNKEA